MKDNPKQKENILSSAVFASIQIGHKETCKAEVKSPKLGCLSNVNISFPAILSIEFVIISE